MKCRLSHVTNSSSSSFIIAKHESCKIEDIKTALNNIRDDIKKMLEDDGEYFYFRNEDIKDLLKINDIEQATDLAIEELTDKLYHYTDYNPLVLGYWECCAEEFYDDDGDFFAIFLINNSYKINCNTLKIGGN